jgi:acyl carrier protein
VIHAAASFSNAPIASLSDADVTRMLAPKLDGTVVLEQLLDTQPVDWVVLFSSTTALFGAAGFAHYAAANAFLDATARVLRRAGRPVTSIDWGTWEVMRLVSNVGQQAYREAGLEPLAVNEACDALGRAVSNGLPQAIVARIDWNTLKPLHEARRRRPFFSEVGQTEGMPARAVRDTTTTGLRERLAALSATARVELVIEFVTREAAAVLGSDADTHLPLDTGFFEMGMDSLMSVELRSRLERAAGRKLPSTLTFNYPNIRALAGYLEGLLSPRPTATSPVASAPTPAPADTLTDIDSDAMSEDDIAAMLSNALQSID